jgi:hypothetical protein
MVKEAKRRMGPALSIFINKDSRPAPRSFQRHILRKLFFGPYSDPCRLLRELP